VIFQRDEELQVPLEITLVLQIVPAFLDSLFSLSTVFSETA